MAQQENRAGENPFSQENAWKTFLESREKAIALRDAFQRGEKEGAPVREQLLRAVEAVGWMTNNTIFLRIVKKALEARDQG